MLPALLATVLSKTARTISETLHPRTAGHLLAYIDALRAGRDFTNEWTRSDHVLVSVENRTVGDALRPRGGGRRPDAAPASAASAPATLQP